MTSDGNITIRSGIGTINIQDDGNTGAGAQSQVIFKDSAGTNQAKVGMLSNINSDLYIDNQASGNIIFTTSGNNRIQIDPSGHLTPTTDDAYDLGTSSLQWRNGYFDGTVNCDGLDVAASITCDGITSDGDMNINTGSGGLFIRDSNSNGNASTVYIEGKDSNNSAKWQVGSLSTSNQDIYIKNIVNGQINFATANSDRMFLTSAGHLVPNGGNNYDLGDSTNRWRNVYTNDLNLSNEGGANDVDGTWGSWTIQEGEDDLFLLNRRNGKKYKFNLTEVN
jgi:hypothetical protein